MGDASEIGDASETGDAGETGDATRRDADASDAGDQPDEAGAPAREARESVAQTAVPPRHAPPAAGGFGWRGWVLVAAMVACFLVIPGAIVAMAYRPGFVESLGLTFQDAYLVLPTVPALVLAGIAVWAAVNARRE